LVVTEKAEKYGRPYLKVYVFGPPYILSVRAPMVFLHYLKGAWTKAP